MLKPATKLERVNLIANVVSKLKGEVYTLPQWLEIINNRLPNQNAFRSTKQLAFAFRNVCIKHNISFEKHKNMVNMDTIKTSNTYYKVNLE